MTVAVQVLGTKVRQGSALSCALFALCINDTIHAINSYGPDGFLGYFHCLLLVDDTVIFASTREAIQGKLERLKESTFGLEIRIHPTKYQYLVVNSSDTTDFMLGDVIVTAHTETYLAI